MAVAVLIWTASSRAADIGTAFTFQGSLENPPGTPVDDICDFRFRLFDAAAGGNLKGTNPQDKPGVTVDQGVFTINDLDFGALAINGTARWLEIEVISPLGRCCEADLFPQRICTTGADCGVGECGFCRLGPRVELTPVPHALALPGLYTQQNAISPNLIGGFSGNMVTAGVVGATIAGGGVTGAFFNNRVTDNYGTIGGGQGNQAGDAAGTTEDREWATVGGGFINTAWGQLSTVGGGVTNFALGEFSTVGGGINNGASGDSSTIGGGSDNVAGKVCVGGDFDGLVCESNSDCLSPGTCSGGHSATVCGGIGNKATGSYSMVPGGNANSAGGYYSFAAGRQAKVRNAIDSGDTDGDEGTFVWADSAQADFTSTGPNQFLIRASGGAKIYSDSAATVGVQLAAGGNSWSAISDRNVKENVRPVDSRELLDRLAAIPIGEWNLISQDPSIRHIGPMAQDFHAAFGVGEVETHISSSDADGVALAAVQGLYEIVKEKDCEIEELRSEIEKLKEAIDRRP